MRSRSASKQDCGVRADQERRPQHRGPNREMIVEMAGGGTENVPGIAGGVQAGFAKAPVCVLVVRGEIQIVLDERRTRKSVVAHAVTANPGIDKREREQEQEEKDPRRESAEAGGAGICVVQAFHNRSTPLCKLLQELIPAVDPE